MEDLPPHRAFTNYGGNDAGPKGKGKWARMGWYRAVYGVVTIVALAAAAAAASAAAPRPEADELFRTGLRYEHAEGVVRDYDIARAFYCSADRHGHPGAAFNIGWMYANGRGVARDDAQAAAWFLRAESRGHVHAARVLRLMKNAPPKRAVHCGKHAEIQQAHTPVIEPSTRENIVAIVRELAPNFGIDPDPVLAVISVESAFRKNAVSPKNAQGLMQLIPATAERFGVRDVFDPVQNLRGGMAYLARVADDVTFRLRVTSGTTGAP